MKAAHQRTISRNDLLTKGAGIGQAIEGQKMAAPYINYLVAYS